MGFDQNSTRLLMHCHNQGVDFSDTMMIGRQSLLLRHKDLLQAARDFGISIEPDEAAGWLSQQGTYAEGLLARLGAGTVHSMDQSGYEGASHLHDMNLPLDEGMKQQYSLVVDSGTLEHVFNFPIALKNCMEMVKPGGHFIMMTPANNVCGHGFYQFSPELFHSAFQQSNGFEILEMAAYEATLGSPWYRVIAPETARKRVTLLGSVPVYLYVLARRISVVTPFESPPQQSDYLAAWQNAGWGATSDHTKRFFDSLVAVLPLPVRRLGMQILRMRPSRRGFRREFFSKLAPVTKPPSHGS